MFPLAYDGERIIKYIDKHAVSSDSLLGNRVEGERENKLFFILGIHTSVFF